MWFSKEPSLNRNNLRGDSGSDKIPTLAAPSASNWLIDSLGEDFLSDQAGCNSQICRDTQAGMSTAEYAVGTIAAVAFAAVLIGIARSDWAHSTLQSIFERALSIQ